MLVSKSQLKALAPTCVVLSQKKFETVVFAVKFTVVSSASAQSSVVAPKKLMKSSCVKLTVPSGFAISRRISPCINRFSGMCLVLCW